MSVAREGRAKERQRKRIVMRRVRVGQERVWREGERRARGREWGEKEGRERGCKSEARGREREGV